MLSGLGSRDVSGQAVWAAQQQQCSALPWVCVDSSHPSPLLASETLGLVFRGSTAPPTPQRLKGPSFSGKQKFLGSLTAAPLSLEPRSLPPSGSKGASGRDFLDSPWGWLSHTTGSYPPSAPQSERRL